jgi:tetratricopeptide (TPR) repeat protein
MRFCITLFTLLLSCVAFSQNPFRAISFDAALTAARQSSKLVLVQYESAVCKECNEVADKAFQDESLAARFRRDFVCIKISPMHTDRAAIASLYSRKSDSFGILFIDAEKNLVHQYPGSASMSEFYTRQASIALEKAAAGDNVQALEKQVLNGSKDIAQWEQLLKQKRALSLPTDSLLQIYVQMLPQDSLKQTRTLQFISTMSPLLQSLADSIMRKDPTLFNKAWYGLSLQTRVGTNNNIIRKSMQRAIREKSEPLAISVANFAKATHTKNPNAAAKAFDMNMLNFYEQTGDTAKFFTKSVAYYERYFMNVNPDAVKKVDSATAERLRQTSTKDTILQDGKIGIRTMINFAPEAQNLTRELTQGASKFYGMTRNPYLLSVATEWVRKGLQFYDLPEAWEIYGRLLYRQGQQPAAIDAIKKAIALRKEAGFAVKEQEALYLQMKKGAAHID